MWQPSTAAPDCPRNWERIAHTRDGVVFRIRPMRPEDGELDFRFITQLSPLSRYNRMFHVMKEPSAAMLHSLVHVDYKRNMAFVALSGTPPHDEIIGVSRYAATGSGREYEFAIAVADAWQGRGVGAALTRQLFAYARAQGINRVQADILPSNQQMLELARWLGLKAELCPDDHSLIRASGATRQTNWPDCSDQCPW